MISGSQRGKEYTYFACVVLCEIILTLAGWCKIRDHVVFLTSQRRQFLMSQQTISDGPGSVPDISCLDKYHTAPHPSRRSQCVMEETNLNRFSKQCGKSHLASCILYVQRGSCTAWGRVLEGREGVREEMLSALTSEGFQQICRPGECVVGTGFSAACVSRAEVWSCLRALCT